MTAAPDRSQQQGPRHGEAFVVLMVGLDCGAAESIRRYCGTRRWICDQVRSGREALGYRCAARDPRPAIVLCAEILPDGSWLQLLSGIGRPLIVVSRAGDERLWAEALNLGAHDLLLNPVTEPELQWSLDSARLEWERDGTPASEQGRLPAGRQKAGMRLESRAPVPPAKR